MQNKKFVYEGNVKITEDNQKEWYKKLKKIKKITGDLFIYSNVKLEAPQLQTVGGDLSIYSNVKLELIKRLYKNNKKNKWYVNDKCNEWLLEQTGNFIYKINNIEFEKKLFDKIRKDTLTAEEVFKLTNIEQRRIAYEKMNKVKMKSLKNYTIIEAKIDEYKNDMKIISFNIEGFKNPFIYFNCICPSTKREYFLETKSMTCQEAKSKSFGFDNIIFDQED